ncbi:hypothetical protein [Winogradskyella sp. 3972H.M.0a.05]|uniref:hypothetical protein n=1 Tax=Winogradskyella sp. 3972H.M.0a.05 TaxID=2950277 RepID=UPI003394545B
MSENLSPNQNNNEEVDLGQLFSAIGNLFERLFRFIGGIFKSLFSALIYVLKTIIINTKLIVIVLAIAAIGGYALDKIKPDVYSSKMVVRPYFDTKYQLIDNIEYFNALIDGENYGALSKIFSISEEDVEKIKTFEIEIGPETENDQIVKYDQFIKSIDSTRGAEISFDDFIENRNLYSGDIFEILVESTKSDIFRDLEGGLNSAFANEYSETKMRKRDSLIAIQKENILESIEEVERLQEFYINVLEEESKSGDSKYTFGENLSLVPESSETKEYELLNEEIRLRNELRKLDERKIQDDVFFDVISSFQQVGNKSSDILKSYIFLIPVAALALLSLIFLLGRLTHYVKNYEA